jgi:hypothetical protein
VVERFGDIGNWEEVIIVVKENSVEMVLRFSKEEEVEKLGIEPKL